MQVSCFNVSRIQETIQRICIFFTHFSIACINLQLLNDTFSYQGIAFFRFYLTRLTY